MRDTTSVTPTQPLARQVSPGVSDKRRGAEDVGVLHTVTGAMLMLNTDLHVADLSKHMSRADFVRNAMRAIQESMPDASSTSEILREDSGLLGSESSFGTPSKSGQAPTQTHPSAHRSASAPVMGHPAPIARMASEAGLGLDSKGRSSSTNLGVMYSRTWESETESALKVSAGASAVSHS